MNILASAGAVGEDSLPVRAASLVGSTPVALLNTLLVASSVLGARRGRAALVLPSTTQRRSSSPT